MKKIAISLLSILATSAFAEIWMPRIFNDNMVLQAGMPNKIWGPADANGKVLVQIAGKKITVKANDKGEWVVKTAKLKKSLKPVSFTVSENGKEQKNFKNVLVGEVWILGGQSNMQWSMNKTTDFEAAKARINPNIRIFSQPSSTMAKTPMAELHEKAIWNVADEKSVPPASAVGYYFAEMLAKELKTPVGLVETPLGGSSMIAWIAKDKLTTEFLSKELEKFEKLQSTYDYEKAKSAHKAKLAKLDKEAKAKKWSKQQLADRKKAVNRTMPNPVSPWRPHDTPSYLWNAKVAPLAGFTAKGILWYQGESDAGKNRYKNFSQTFTVLIKSWREAWGVKNMPFYFFQLPSYETKSFWSSVRVSQQSVANKMKGVYMVPIVDSGEEKDIHPRDKTFVCKRLFALAMNKTYRKSAYKCDHAQLMGVKYSGQKAIAKFSKKLVVNGDLRGFEVLVDTKWIAPTSLRVSGDSVEVVADANIKGVRYLWKSWAKPDACLFTAFSNFPVSTFTSANKAK